MACSASENFAPTSCNFLTISTLSFLFAANARGVYFFCYQKAPLEPTAALTAFLKMKLIFSADFQIPGRESTDRLKQILNNFAFYPLFERFGKRKYHLSVVSEKLINRERGERKNKQSISLVGPIRGEGDWLGPDERKQTCFSIQNGQIREREGKGARSK